MEWKGGGGVGRDERGKEGVGGCRRWKGEEKSLTLKS